jgi:integrase
MLRKVCGKGRRSWFRPLSPEWVALRDTVTDQQVIWKLSRLMAFCSAVEVTPCHVNDVIIERFRTAVHESDEVSKPEQLVRLAIRAWNTLAASSSGLENTQLVLAPRRVPRWTIEPDKFLASFRQEVASWLDGLSKVDPEAEEGPIRPLRPESLKLRRHQVFKAASALVYSGCPIETITSLSSLVDIDAFKAILKHLRERQGGKKSTALHGLATALKYLAKHHVKVSPDHLTRISRLCANHAVEDDGLSKSHRRQMKFEDERLLGALLHLPDRLLEEAAHPRTSRRHARLLAQMAIAVEIEIQMPIRRANLARLNLQRDIQAVVVKGETRWLIRFGRDETKNHTFLVYELPAISVKRIERAMTFYTCKDGWLFPGANGTHKELTTLGKQIKQEVESRLGCEFNVHLFRGLMATTQVVEDDNGFEIARALLGDRSDRVVRKHYTAAAEKRLIRKAQEIIQRVRVRTAPIVPRNA